MSIVNTTLHPEDDQNVNLYPKTSSEQVTDFLSKTYPIGSIYLSVGSTSPASLFGGTWTKIKDKFLLTDGDTYTAGNTGGSATHSHGTDNVYSQNGTLRACITAGITDHDIGYIPSSVNVSTDYNITVAGATFTLNTTAKARSSLPKVTGQTEPSNVLPPYLVVYGWYRIA